MPQNELRKTDPNGLIGEQAEYKVKPFFQMGLLSEDNDVTHEGRNGYCWMEVML